MIPRLFIPILVLVFLGSPLLASAQESNVSSSTLKSQFLAKEKEAAELARRIRSSPADAEQLKAALRLSVGEAFALRQQLHQAELADFQKRMAKVQQTIQTREQRRDKIIDRRVDDLLDPDVPWDMSQESGGDSQRQGGVANAAPLVEPPTRAETRAADGAVPLLDAIGDFNRKYASHPIGKHQPPLTDEEVIASIRWATMERKKSNLGKELNDEDFESFRRIAAQRYLPSRWYLEGSTLGVNGFRAWSVRLRVKTDAPEDPSHEIRRQFIGWHGADGQAAFPPANQPAPADAKSMPLTAAINGFNAAHRSFAGQEQPPLTEEEVVAAILAAKADRNQFSVSNADFAAFQAIGETRSMPAGAVLELLPSFKNFNGFDFSIWSVRIVMPRTDKEGWTFGFSVRERFIRSEAVENENISWGKPGENGLQAGVLFEPRNEQYTYGQSINTRFYFRNAGTRKLTVAFPRLMTRSYYEGIHVTDASGNNLVVESVPEPGGPVGWQQMMLDPGATHQITGMPITVTPLSRDARFESAIHAKAGAQCRVSYTISNFADTKLVPLETGKISFTVPEPPPGVADPTVKAAPQAAEQVQLRFLVFGTSREEFRRLVMLTDPNDKATDRASYSPVAGFDKLIEEMQATKKLEVIAKPTISTSLNDLQKSTIQTSGGIPTLGGQFGITSQLQGHRLDLVIDCTTTRPDPNRGPIVDLTLDLAFPLDETKNFKGGSTKRKLETRKFSSKIDLTAPNDRMIFAPFGSDGKEASMYVLVQLVTPEPKPPVASKSAQLENPLGVPLLVPDGGPN
jgi:hypothetical protein